MSITSMSNRARMAENLTIEQLQRSIQDGVLPSYIGVPLLKSKVEDAKLLQAAKAAQSMSQQPSVAQQIMSQAQQVEQGVDALPTNLPTTAMAGGGIVAFAEGGMYDDEDSDEDRQDAARQAEMDEMMDEYAQSFQQGIGQLPAAQSAAPQGGEGIASGDVADFVARIMHKESRGQRYGKDGKLLTSEKGAQGEMQVMPGTSRDPGFGVKPARDNSPDELARVGRDYANTLLERYGDPKLAAIAYNMGPGATDKWLAAGADMSKLPKETQGYVKGFANGGAIRFQNRGLVNGQIDPELMSQIDIVGSQLDEARNELKKTPAPGQRQMMADPEALDRYQAAKARKEALELGYENIMNSAGVGQASFGNFRGALGTKKPEANPFVQAMGAQQPTNADKKISDKPKVEAVSKVSPVYGDDTYDPNVKQMVMGDSSRSPAASAGDTVKADPYAKFEELFAQREGNLAKQREQDKYLALLQAGLGMMGGTSPNALANIGAGASQGLQSLAEARKAATAEENALLSGRLGLAKIGSNKEYQDAMMAYRKDLAKANDARARELAGANADQKTGKYLSDIEDKIRAQVSKDVAGNAILSVKPDVEAIKEQMIQDRLRAHGTYGRKYKEYHGEDPFAAIGGGKGDNAGWSIKPK